MKSKIILIEDDQDNFDIIETVLSMEGFEVIRSNEETLNETIAVVEPSLILLDNWLKTTLGSELCRSIKNNRHIRQIPVLLISAATGLEKIAAECQADGFINKPFEIDELCATIKNTIQKYAFVTTTH
jgi:DNA-binding response OmpR family regulator